MAREFPISNGKLMTDLDADGHKILNLKGGGGGETTDYNDLDNKPSINGKELSGNKTAKDLGLASAEDLGVKRDKTDNIAAADETLTGAWEFHCSDPTVQDVLNRSGKLVFDGDYWYLYGNIDGYSGPEEGIIEAAHDATSLVFRNAYFSEHGYVHVTATRSVSLVTKEGEPYVTPTGVKALVPKTELHALVPETSEGKVTLKPVDGNANWVEGKVEAQSGITGRSFSTEYEMLCDFLWVSDDESEDHMISVIFTCPINDGNSVIEGIYSEGYEGEWICHMTTTQDIPAEVDGDHLELFEGVMIPKGTALSYHLYNVEVEEGCTDLSQCCFRTDYSAPGPWDAMTSIPETLEVDGRHYARDLVDIVVDELFTHQVDRRDSAAVAVTLPASTDSAKARRFSLAVETDTDTEKAVEWQGGEVIEAVPGSSKLVPGLNVWEVAEVAPGKFRVDRVSSPAQSAPLTLTAPNGRVAELAVDDDLVLEVKEV